MEPDVTAGGGDPARIAIQPAQAHGQRQLGECEMHVEALAWSGMSLSAYAAALRLSAKSLRTWRDRIEAEEGAGHWRTVGLDLDARRG